MPIAICLFLLAAAPVLAALLRSTQRGTAAPPPAAPRPPEIEPADAERLGEVIELLRAVMDHGELGGPGYITVQFPPLAGGAPTVTAQYPNINEALYRRTVRRELDRAEPGALFAHSPAFAAESGGVVVLTAEVRGLTPDLAAGMADRRRRGPLLAALAEALEGGDLSVRALGQELLVECRRR